MQPHPDTGITSHRYRFQTLLLISSAQTISTHEEHHVKRSMLAAATLLLATAVQAEERMFFERPIFMTNKVPESIPCERRSGLISECAVVLPAKYPAKVVNADGSGLKIEQVDTFAQILCTFGTCFDEMTQAPAGEVSRPYGAAENMASRWYVNAGMYLHQDATGKVTAWKQGFGPLGDKYPPYAIYTEPNPESIAARGSADDEVVKLNNPEDQTYSNAEVWPVWCQDGKSTCDVAGQVKDKEVLFKEMPTASWGYCQGDFCYGDTSLTDVIGLNPAIHN